MLPSAKKYPRITRPEHFIYKLLMRESGPQSASTNDYDMDTDSDLVPSVFVYTVPDNERFELARINFMMVDGSMRPGHFGGLGAALTNGCLLEIVDSNGVQRIDFLDGVPITFNAEFSLLAGVDTIIQPAAGDDWLPVRWTIARAGDEMNMGPGDQIRFVVQDDISGLTYFRAMAQGLRVS